MNTANLKYISNDQGDRIAVIVPIEVWEELTSGDETSYLMQSATMRKRLLAAKNRQTGISLEEACEKLGI